ncbi:hypothetical protein B0H16DRAFT_1458110 [Mycena metata]|uniref:Uncharacterized protein n=1 Tax=Mycena metata TaxID=1033252 RepID=A0AAD7J472_9AGAR|nr:hypothetical protein B0H16DRAFT_1458110 [Mycena metata]
MRKSVALPNFDPVYIDIAELSKKREHLTLARVSKAFNRLYTPVIYRLNYVGSNAKKFVHLLANNPRLPRLVLKLIFDESADTLADVEEWSAVLPAMSELEEIRLEADFFGVFPGPTQLPRLRLIQGRPADIARCAQHQLKQIWFYPGRRSLKAADLTLLARSPPNLLDICICAHYFTRLLHTGPQMLTTLRHILLDEEYEGRHRTKIK